MFYNGIFCLICGLPYKKPASFYSIHGGIIFVIWLDVNPKDHIIFSEKLYVLRQHLKFSYQLVNWYFLIYRISSLITYLLMRCIS